MSQEPTARVKPRHPLLGAMGARIALPVAERYFRHKQVYRHDSRFAAERRETLRARLARGDTVYLAGMSMGGFHNSGVALVEVSAAHGPRIICNNEEERFSGRKHADHYPTAALTALRDSMDRLNIGPQDIHAWLATFDYPAFVATGIRHVLEEFPGSINLARQETPGFDVEEFKGGFSTPARLGRFFGRDRGIPVIGLPHHDNHAWFSYLVSPFARETAPVMIAVIDGGGDCASVSTYVGENGTIGALSNNGSMCDSPGTFYSVISSTQGGWTVLSSEGRYMGAAAYGDMDRTSNRYYHNLRHVFALGADGEVRLNRSLANWHCDLLRNPYSPELTRVLGPPLAPEAMWNPDAVLNVDDIHHSAHTRERADKAAATQLVFEDAVIHLIDGFIRRTGSDRLVLTGGSALNAVANMRLLEHFDEDYYARTLGRRTRLHLWVPPVPGDAGAPVGAAYAFAGSAGVTRAPPLRHAFYCGHAPRLREIMTALHDAADLDWLEIGNARSGSGLEAVADLMAYVTSRDGVIGIVQGAAETGPRALGHRSILASACNPHTRELINERVKHREAIRPLAPLATLRAARELFELSEGAADDDYNAYNYMVVTVRAKPHARQRVPAVVHADGTARIQIVRQDTDPVTWAYLTALGRRTGVEVAVNTSFNVAGPIAQTPQQSVDTLRRARGMDGLFMFAEEGPVLLAWPKQSPAGTSRRLRQWLTDWRMEVQENAGA